METKLEIARDWLPRYTGMPLDQFGPYILLTNFKHYVLDFSERFNTSVYGLDHPMQACTNQDGLTIINYGMGSSNAATIMDLLCACDPKGVLFLGKCGSMKPSTEIGHFVLPIGAIRAEGTSDEYLRPEVPALPSFKLHKFVSQKILESGFEYRTGVVYSTNRRVWEHDADFHQRVIETRSLAVDMETATIFVVGHYNHIARGALLLVSDAPFLPDGVKTSSSDCEVTQGWSQHHLNLGISAMMDIGANGETIKHFEY